MQPKKIHKVDLAQGAVATLELTGIGAQNYILCRQVMVWELPNQTDLDVSAARWTKAAKAAVAREIGRALHGFYVDWIQRHRQRS